MSQGPEGGFDVKTHLVPYLGSLGLGSLLAALLLMVMQPERQRIWIAFLVLGSLSSLTYLFQHRRGVWSFAKLRSAREGANSAVLIAILVGIVFAVNYLADRRSRQWDFTAARQFSLSEQTGNILGDLDEELSIILLDRSRPGPARDLLKLYDDASPRVRVEVLDPEAEPARAERFKTPGETRIPPGTVVLQSGDRSERATAVTEPELTKALIRLLESETKTILFTGGHQEHGLAETDGAGLSAIRAKLEDSVYAADSLVLLQSARDGQLTVPEEAAAVVVAGPRVDFLPEEIAALDRYLRGGGNAVFLIDPDSQGEKPNLVAFAGQLGAHLGKDFVIDLRSGPPEQPVVMSYGRHPIVESFANSVSAFRIVRSVTPAEELPKGVRADELFSSLPETSWAETSFEEEGFGPEGDRLGPINLGLALTITHAPGKDEDDTPTLRSRVVVVGDSDFIGNNFTLSPVVNADLFLNMINWVTEDEELIAIRPREAEDRRVFLNQQQLDNVLFFSLLVLPGILLVTGISVWWSRR